MKFKSIFIIFNIVIFISFAFVFAMPLFVLGIDFAATFWKSSWPLAALLLLILAAFDAFFLINNRLFTLLEREDWPALVQYLEERVIKGGRYSPRLVKLLIHSYLVLSDPASIITLKDRIAKKKPTLISANVLLFGIAYILKGNHDEALQFFKEQETSGTLRKNEWAQWYLCFVMMLQKQYAEATDRLIHLA
ncbi:MAG: hypothetical protein SNJ56_03325, partial [Termitinemataceae bacterium]